MKLIGKTIRTVTSERDSTGAITKEVTVIEEYEKETEDGLKVSA